MPLPLLNACAKFLISHPFETYSGYTPSNTLTHASFNSCSRMFIPGLLLPLTYEVT